MRSITAAALMISFYLDRVGRIRSEHINIVFCHVSELHRRQAGIGARGVRLTEAGAIRSSLHKSMRYARIGNKATSRETQIPHLPAASPVPTRLLVNEKIFC